MNIVLEKTIYLRAPELFDTCVEEYGFCFHFIQPLKEEKALAFHAEQGADVFIIGTKKYSEEFYNALRPGTLIQRFGVGYTHLRSGRALPGTRHPRGLHTRRTRNQLGRLS